MRKNHLTLCTHLLQRFRERWTNCKHLSDQQVERMVLEQVRDGLRTEGYIKTPGGYYFPFSADGRDGFIVVNYNDEIITVLTEGFCPEVTAIQKNGATHVR